MELEKQVCSLELAKRLKALGVKQESLFYWYQLRGNSNNKNWIVSYGRPPFRKFIYSAFSVAELGEMLPKGISTWKTIHEKEKYCCHDTWSLKIDGGHVGYFYGKTMANAMAKMLIYLIEKGLVPAIKS